jgi:hypothetical protein
MITCIFRHLLFLCGGISVKQVACYAGFRIRIHLIRIRIRHFGLNTDPDQIPIQGFYDRKLEKNLQLKKI